MRENGNSRWRPSLLRKLVFFTAVLVLITLACNLPTSVTIDNPFVDASYIETRVAETLVAWEVNQVPKGTTTTLDGTVLPGENITPTLTPTGSSPIGEVKLLVSENTNCRTGQGTSFELLMYLLKGEEAEAVGIDTSSKYWYIRRPDQPNSFCWLWGKYATPTGPYESLPVYTPVPTATPGFEFTINYHSTIGICGGFHVLQYQVTNTGSVSLESWRTSTIDNTGGSVPISNQQDKFFDITGCAPVGDTLVLAPGEAYYVNAMFTNDPAGHDLTVTALVCAQDGLGGGCVSRKISHTP
jgi:hypothetical protein